MTPERSQNARLVRNEAFRDHWGSTETSVEQWEHFIGYGTFRPAFSFLAYAGQEPLGTIIGHEYDAYTEATGTRLLYPLDRHAQLAQLKPALAAEPADPR